MPAYVWSEDNANVTATRVCGNDKSHVETETATATSAVTKQAECEVEGETTYTAVFENKAFSTQTKTVDNISALEHDWSDWDIGWTIDGKLIISRVCAHDLSHIEEKTGDTYEDAVTLLKDVISEELRYVFIASYSENGKMLGVRMIDISNKHESFELPKDAEQIRIMYLDAFFKPLREVSTSVKSKLAVSAE
ncbi:MAG: hypothetical protein II881_08570 [Oscillospiraceae bacterium]|nr:hypothetical protein [Oscillospiraceae bacterium]